MTAHQSVASLIAESLRNFWAEVSKRWRPQRVKALRLVPLAVKPTSRREDIESQGRWYLKRDILDRLDEYFSIVREMRRGDPDAYHLYSRIGAVVGNGRQLLDSLESTGSSSWAKNYHCSFGAVAWLGDESKPAGDGPDDSIYPKFLYFQKFVPGQTILEPTTDQTFKCTLFYIDSGRPKHRIHDGLSFYVAISPDGTPRLLKQLCQKRQKIRHKKPHKGTTTIYHEAWDVPDFLKEWATKRKVTANNYAGWLFDVTYSTYMESSMDTRIAVTKGGVVAAFSVDLLRMPYFFSDRDWVANEAGSRAKIFHIVRTHARVTAGGIVSHVKSHFRGARRFLWNEYWINITMPGFHGLNILETSFGAHLLDARTPGMLDSKEMAKKIVGATYR